MPSTVRTSFAQKPKQARIYHSNQGYRVVGQKKIYFKSGWEVNYAIFLEFLKKKYQIQDWLYEPATFWFNNIKRGVRSYKPDFKIIRLDGTHYWAEVKGYMDAKSLTKIKRFRKYYPEEELQLIEKKWFIDKQRRLPLLCESWENEYTEGIRDVVD
jgi:hypothetical protein